MERIGEHCEQSGCGTLDFLPFQCDFCSRTFCRDHRTIDGHQCEPGLAQRHVIPTCPLCAQAVYVEPNGDPNTAVSVHMDAGCPRRKREWKCARKGCSNRKPFKIACVRCDRSFCAAHRHPEDHSCAHTGGEGDDADGSGGGGGARVRKGYAKLSDAAQANIAKHRTKAYQRDPVKANRLNLMRIRSRAKGDRKVPPERRFYVEAVFPFASKKPTQYVFVDSQWTVGKALDVMAQLGRVRNRNHQMGSEKLFLWSLRDGSRLEPNSAAIGSLPNVSSGDPVLLETEANVLSPQGDDADDGDDGDGTD